METILIGTKDATFFLFQYFKVLEWIHWFFRMHFFSYQGIAFLLLEVNLILKYYNSIYHAGLILWIILYVIGLQLLKAKKKREKKLLEGNKSTKKE